ncbi:MAG: NADH-quinone oxidoreductase subunit NuoE family protein [Planctomycetota bacterium]|jgi:NADH-quinone oxidoreductase subunit E
MAEENGSFPPEHLKERFDEIVERYPRRVAALIPLLMKLQAEYRHITKGHMEGLAEYLDTTPAHVLGVMTFYTMLSQKKRGKHHVYVCKTLSCHLRGAPEVLAAFEEKLGVTAHSGEATEDEEFSLDTGECLGLCEMAPCILVDDERYGNLTPEMVDKIIEELRG